MTRLSAFLFIAASALNFSAGISAYEARTAGDGNPLRWEEGTESIPYFIDRDGCADIADGTEFTAIQSAFQTWENVATGKIEFRFLGVADRSSMDERTSVIMWMEEEWPYDSSYIAMTRLYYNRKTGRILKVEIMLNGRDYRWSTNGEAGTLDVQNVATHEVGHFIGLADVQVAGRTMFEYITPGETEKCYLSDDEIDGVQAVYPLIGDDEKVVVRSYTLAGGRSLVHAGSDPVVTGSGGLPALCPLGPVGSPPPWLGLIRARTAGGTLTVYGPEGTLVRRYELITDSDLKPGRLLALSSLDIDGDGVCAEIAALASTADGVAAFLGAIPSSSPSRDEIIMRPFSLGEADNLVSFAPLFSGESGFGSAVVTVEKRHNRDFYVSIAKAVRAEEAGRDFVLEPLRVWQLADCQSVVGVTALTGEKGECEIGILQRNEAGALEIAVYSPPFSRLPSNGDVKQPSRRVDAEILAEGGRPLGLCASGPAGRISVLLVQ